MFDLGSWGEFFIIIVAALVLIGPKELPGLLKTLGRWTYKGKKALNQFRQTYDVYFQEGEIEEYINETNRAVLKENPSESSSSSSKVAAKKRGSSKEKVKASQSQKDQSDDA